MFWPFVQEIFLSHVPPDHLASWKSIALFLHNPANKQTNRQDLLGGGKYQPFAGSNLFSNQSNYLYPGLCGDFNDIQADDLRTTSGLIEGTARTFANTWKTKASCPDVTTTSTDPCSYSMGKGMSPKTCSYLKIIHQNSPRNPHVYLLL